MTESQALPEVEAQRNGGEALAVAATSAEKVGSKRQRRPSVRLGDIGGDQSFDSLNPNRRSTKPHQHKQHSTTNNKSSKNRSQFHETLDAGEANLDSVAIGSWKVGDSKSKRATSTKRIRSNWASKTHHDDDDGGDHGEDEDIDDNDEDEDEDGFKGFDSGSPWVKDSDYERDGVRVWLNQLGLGRYAPVFEIHEVDDEVLPMLTLEDLKDMGINAVGSRRKMYASIQKLGKGFS